MAGFNYNDSAWGKATSKQTPAPKPKAQAPSGGGNGWSVTLDKSDDPGYVAPKKQPTTTKASGSGGSKGGGQTAAEKAISKQQKAIQDAADARQKLRESQMGDSEKAFQDMLDGLGGTYDGYEKTAKEEYDLSKATEAENLAARMRANGTEDSEQRNQAEERLTSKYATDYAKYLEKLAGQEATARTNIGMSRAEALNKIRNDQASDEYGNLQAKMTAWQQEFDNDMASQQNARANSSAAGSAGAKTNKGAAYAITRAQELMQGKEGSIYDTPGLAQQIANETASIYGGEAGDYMDVFTPGYATAQSPGGPDWASNGFDIYNQRTGETKGQNGTTTAAGRPTGKTTPDGRRILVDAYGEYVE